MSLVHASACIIAQRGVLVRGASGAGKSLLVRRLVEDAARRGRFAVWVGDDQVHVEGSGGALIARPVPAIAGQAELRFHGPTPVAHAAAARIDLVVDLEATVDRLPEAATVSIEGVVVPRIAVPKSDLSHAISLVDAVLFQIS